MNDVHFAKFTKVFPHYHFALYGTAMETSKDSVLMNTYYYVMEGWPNKLVKENIQSFYQCKDQLIKTACCGD